MDKGLISASQYKALCILKKHPGIRPREFAKLMWPDSECWSHSTKCGHGSTRAGGMNLAGGGYIGKLAKQGYIDKRFKTYDHGYTCVLTRDGIEALIDYETANDQYDYIQEEDAAKRGLL